MPVASPAIDLALVMVNLGLAHETPFAKPEKAEAWKRGNGGDTVRFISHEPFTVEFHHGSPFPEEALAGAKNHGLYVAEGTVRPDAEERAYKYDLSVAGHRIDPEIVVRGDPQG